MKLEQHMLKAYVDRHAAYQSIREQVVACSSDIARQEREKSGMSLRKYAAYLKVTPGYLSKVENGMEPLTPDVARRMLG